MQRLFSTFANGWPGAGLLMQRVLIAILLLRFWFMDFTSASSSPWMILQLLASLAGILLLAGLWTPVAGTFIALLEVLITVVRVGDPWISSILAALGITVAMIGPGAWSLDARIFGRKHMAI